MAFSSTKTFHNTGLKLAAGAFRYSPIPSVLNIAKTPLLDLNRAQNFILCVVNYEY